MQKLNDTGIHLTIAGEVWGKSNEEQLAKKIEKIKNVNIEYSFEYVDEKQAANYFERADVVVLPYLSATGSGVITLAYHYRKPVIASAVGGLPDVVVDKKTGWLTPPNAPEKLAQTIKNIDRKKTVSMQPAIKKFCQENSWDNMATAIIDFTGK
jgi:glycosyltransferase involved in cell wall biosynthesis